MNNKKDQQEATSSHLTLTEGANQTVGNESATTHDDSTTDPDNDSLTTGRIASTERSSASATKTNVTGSDLDGQTSF